MPPSNAERLSVYLSPQCKAVFGRDEYAVLRKKKPIERVVDLYQIWVEPHSRSTLVSVLQSLLKDSIFISKPAARSAFPELFHFPPAPTSVQSSTSTRISRPHSVGVADDIPDMPQPSPLLKHSKMLLDSGLDSDLVVWSADKQHNLHHNFFCLRSSVFQSFCRLNGIKHGNDRADIASKITCGGVIDLKTDDPHAVECLIHFLYSDDYEVPLDDNGPVMSPFLLHAKIHTLAECYDVQDLKPLARSKFEKLVSWGETAFGGPQCIEDVDGFIAAMDEAFKSVNTEDSCMQTLIARAFKSHLDQLLSLKAVEDLMEENGMIGLFLAHQFRKQLKGAAKGVTSWQKR